MATQQLLQDIMSTAAGFSEQEEEEGEHYAWYENCHDFFHKLWILHVYILPTLQSAMCIPDFVAMIGGIYEYHITQQYVCMYVCMYILPTLQSASLPSNDRMIGGIHAFINTIT